MRVSEDVLAVLSAAKTDGPSLILQGQLDRNLYTATNKVLEAAGGKWNRGKKAHIFDADAADRIDQIILTGDITIPQDFGFYPTPPEVVAQLVALAEASDGMKLLEPSAGIGSIAQAFPACEVHAYELLPANAAKLLPLNLASATVADFLSIAPDPSFDRVVMNPPFEKQADIKHVLHAAKFVKPGGILVSVMSAGVTFREDKRTAEFCEFVDAHSGIIERLPEGAFKKSGTMVNTVIVKIRL